MSQNLSIAYLNQHLLEHPKLLPVLNDIDTKLPGLVHGRNEFIQGYIPAFYNRVGKNTMFCKNPGTFNFTQPVVDYSKVFTQTFDQVSDQRCIDLRASQWHKPWVIMWSGGIDSTVIITSILRNISPADFKNIQIWCNSTSVYENPKFFLDHIQPNFEVIFDPDVAYMYHDVFLFAGESEYVLGNYSWNRIYADQSGFDKSGRDLFWADNRDHMITQLNAIGWPSASKNKFSNWLYNILEENIRSTGLPIQTISEWYWWILFNHQFGGQIMFNVDQHCVKENHSRYIENFVPWFHGAGYQQWGIHNLNNIVRTKNKSIGKQYIHTVLKDENYLNFKTKVDSNNRPANRVWFIKNLPHQMEHRPRTWDIDFVQDDRIFCVLTNNELLYLDQDFDRIAELLPDHINLDSLDYL